MTSFYKTSCTKPERSFGLFQLLGAKVTSKMQPQAQTRSPHFFPPALTQWWWYWVLLRGAFPSQLSGETHSL